MGGGRSRHASGRPTRARASGARRRRSDSARRRRSGSRAAGRRHHRLERSGRCHRDPDGRLRADPDCRSAHRSRRRGPRGLARPGGRRASRHRRRARTRIRQPSRRSGRGGWSVNRRLLLRSRFGGPSAFRGGRMAGIDDERMVFRAGRSRPPAIRRWRDCGRSHGPDTGTSTAAAPHAISSNQPACRAIRSSSRSCARRAIPSVLCSYRRDGAGAGRIAGAICPISS